MALYRAEDVERASDGFRRALGAAEGPGPVGTARAALEDGLLRLGEFALAAPCPRLCVPLQVSEGVALLRRCLTEVPILFPSSKECPPYKSFVGFFSSSQF